MTGGHALPPGAIDPRAGDFVVRPADGGFEVLHVDDVVALTRLVALEGERRFLDEGPLRDSEPPAYEGEIFVLARGYDARFTSADAAIAAIDAGSVGAARERVCVPVRDLPESSVRVHRPG